MISTPLSNRRRTSKPSLEPLRRCESIHAVMAEKMVSAMVKTWKLAIVDNLTHVPTSNYEDKKFNCFLKLSSSPWRCLKPYYPRKTERDRENDPGSSRERVKTLGQNGSHHALRRSMALTGAELQTLEDSTFIRIVLVPVGSTSLANFELCSRAIQVYLLSDSMPRVQ